MSKRFAAIFFISLASLIILFVFLFILLFLAPGVSLFGLKYIAHGTHTFSTGEVDLYDYFGSRYSTIILNTYEVPVEVRFTGERQVIIEFYESYEGLTKSKIQDPSIDYSIVDGQIVITTSEFHRAIYETSTSKRYFKIYFPVTDLIDENAYKLYINSTHSPVSFHNDAEENTLTPKFNTLSITTSGAVNYQTKVDTKTYVLSTASSITINNDGQNMVNAENYFLKSSSGKISVQSPVSGDLHLETKNGSISLVSCKNLYVSTKYGNVSRFGDGEITVDGIAEISTTAGNVTLGEVKAANGESKISTSSGNVKITQIQNGSVTTKRGRVEIKSVNAFKIETDVGKVYVEEALSSIEVTTKRGDIHLGGENMPMANPKVFSRLGRVYVNSASGDVDIETISSNVEFNNTSSQNIRISSGGKLTANKLTGKVNIFAEKDSKISFERISDISELEFGASCNKIEITALNNTKEDVGYRIYGSSVVISELKNGSYIQSEGMDGNNRTEYTYNNSGTTAYLGVKSKDNKARVELYLKAPN